MAVFRYAFVLLLVASWSSLPISAQELRQESCSKGEVWIPDDGIDVEITTFCQSVKVAGNSNTIIAAEIGELTLMGNANNVTALQVGELMAMGNDNIVNYRAGSEPKARLSGDRNSLVALGDSNTAKPTDNKSPIKALETNTTSRSSEAEAEAAAEAANEGTAAAPAASSAAQEEAAEEAKNEGS